MAEVQKKEFACTGRFEFRAFLVFFFGTLLCFAPLFHLVCFSLLSFAHAFLDEDEGQYSFLPFAWLGFWFHL